MKLSILIPVYNAEKHIARCLDSVLDQNIPLTDYEVIVRDDGSTDGTLAIIKDYCKKAPNIKLVEDTNKGAYVQRNILMQQAIGDYIYFMDADDYLVRKSLDKVLGQAFAHDLDLSCFEMHNATWQDSENPSFSENTFSPKNVEVISGISFLESNQEMRYEIWWYFIKRDFLIQSGIIFDEERYHNDVLFTLRVFLKASKLLFIPLTIYYYYQSEGSIMRETGRKHSQRLIDAGKKLVSDLNQLIIKVDEEHQSAALSHNLKYARAKFSCYLIMRMIKAGYTYEEITDLMAFLKKIDAYPITHYTGKDMPGRKFTLIKLLINNKLLLKGYLNIKKH